MPPRSRFPKRALVVLACTLAAIGVAAGASAGASPVVHVCDTQKTPPAPFYPSQGYFTSLNVTGTGCVTGFKLMVAYYHCRVHSGKTGRCHGSPLGFSCHEGKRVSISTEFDARVTCHRQHATVVHTYQQFI